MYFTVIGYDATDEEAPKRREQYRPEHLMLLKEKREEGKIICAAAQLDDNGKMNGSVIICDFPSKEELMKWLDEEEPYVEHDVWGDVKIAECKVPPMFRI